MSEVASPQSAAIQAVGLQKTYKSGLFRKKTFEALKGVSFSVNKGEIFGLLGPNGAGKTTFIKVLLGIIRSSGGSADMLGLRAGTRESRRRVGYLPEHLRIRPHHTGLTAMEFYGRLSSLPMSTIKTKRDELLELVGLAARKKDCVKEYSKGMLQRLGLAQALLHDPELIILDEPADGLDPGARADVRSLLSRLKGEGKTIFLNSHLLQEVELICDRVAILDRGNLRFCGAVKEIGQKLTASQGPSRMAINLKLEGEPGVIDAGLKNMNLVKSTSTPDGIREIKIELSNQQEIDETIDNLRRSGVSITGLARHRVSLEDAFLELIKEDHSDKYKLD